MKRDNQAPNSYHHPSMWKVRVYEVLCGSGGWLSIEQLQEAYAKADAAQDELAEEIKAGGYEINQERMRPPFFESLPMGGLKVEAEVVVVPKGEHFGANGFSGFFNKLKKKGDKNYI